MLMVSHKRGLRCNCFSRTICSVFGRKPQALQSEEDVLTGAQWGTLMHEAMQWLPLAQYTQASLTKELDALVTKGTFTEEERNLLSDTKPI